MTTTEATTIPEVVPNKIYRPFREVFPESKLQLDIDLPCFDAPWNTETLKTPPKMEGYVWRDELLIDLILWLLSGKRAAKLIGHTGTGKTSLIMEFAAALNQPLLMVPGTPRTEAYQLIGGMLPTEGGGMAYQFAALGLAAKYGVWCVIDEWNLIDPGEATGMNALLEGYPYTIPETSETLVPEEDFRIIATQNPKSQGYRGRQGSDLSNDDRFIDIVVDYMEQDSEIGLVQGDILALGAMMEHPPSVAAANGLASGYVKFARAVRDAFVGTSDKASALPCTMSTRALRTWVQWTMGCAPLMNPGQSPAHYALRRVLTNRQTPECRKALHDMLEAVTGEKEVV